MTRVVERVEDSHEERANRKLRKSKVGNTEYDRNKSKEIKDVCHEIIVHKKVEKTPKDSVKRNHKKQKKQSTEEEPTQKEESEDDEGKLHEPTLEELRESTKLENIKAIITVRQKKKQKHLKRLETHKDHTKEKEKQRNVEYLEKWKNANASWKFEKLRQISIQSSIFDEEKLDNHIWPIALEYLSASKGAAKTKLIKMAEAVIEELDSQCGKLDDQAELQKILKSARYQRARELLQSID